MSKLGNSALYNGEYFDSYTEACWAGYFDLAGMPFVREPATYRLPNDTIYTPDFYLPDQDTYFEVKNGNADWLACYKARLLARGIGKTVILADGTPKNLALYFMSPESDKHAMYGIPYPAQYFADATLYKWQLHDGNGTPKNNYCADILKIAIVCIDLPQICNDAQLESEALRRRRALQAEAIKLG